MLPMRTTLFVALSVAVVALACGGSELYVDESAEDLGAHQEELQFQTCLNLLTADGGTGSVGSPGFAKALRDCIKGQIADAGFGSGTSPFGDAGFPAVPAIDAGAAVCTIGITCTNGACECAAGPKTGTSCQPADCVKTCMVCQ